MRWLSRPVAAALALAAALLAAQALGLAHRVLHAPGTPHEAAWLDDSHHDEPDCRLYDQLAHGDGLAPSAVAFASGAFVAPPLHAHRAWQLALQAAGALARGPPSIG